MLKIRLRRIGKKRTPFYRVVVAEKETKRDGAFLETLGSYDPHADPPVAIIDAEKTREWIKKGAQPSEAAIKVLQRAGVLEAPVRAETKVAPVGKGKAGAKAAAAAPAAKAAPAAAVVAVADAPAAVAVAEAPEAEAPAIETEPVVAEPEATAEVAEPEAPAAEVEAPAAEDATEAVAEAAIEGDASNEVAQEPGDDDVQAAPTVE